MNGNRVICWIDTTWLSLVQWYLFFVVISPFIPNIIDQQYFKPQSNYDENGTKFKLVKVRYQTIPPSSTLAEYVQFFWTLESDQPYMHRSLADGGIEMIFHYRGMFDEVTSKVRSPSALSAIQGTSSSYRVYTCTSAFGIFGVYFYPFAIPALFAIPTDELSNEMPDLATFLGNEGKILEEKMMTSRNNTERVKVISKFLEDRVKRSDREDKHMHQVIHSVIHATGKMNVDFLANECALSRRQFERRFKMLAGFSPKRYERIVRFQNAADEYTNRNKSLTQIALENGYYDHAHFTNDFKKFSGHNPKDYFSGKVLGHEWREGDIGLS